MASLMALLSSAATALNAQQGAAAVASNNLDNVDTPGYSVETANLDASAMSLAGSTVLGGGVSVGTVSQTRDRFVEAQLPDAFGASAYSQAQSDSLTAVSALDTSNSGGLTQSLSAFWSALQALSQDAGDSGLRTAAVAAAQQVATAFNSTASSISAAQSGLDTQISGSLAQVNSLAAQMASLNQQIQAAGTPGGQQPNALLDARQNVQDQLETLTGAQPITDAQGDVSLSLPGGAMLVSAGLSATLSAAPDPSNGGHLALSITPPGGTTPAALPDAAIGGQLGGWLSARDGALATAASSIDQLASDFAGAVNGATSSSYGLDNSTGLDLFTVGSTVAGTAASISVNSAIVADPSQLGTKGSAAAGDGDASGLQNLLNVQTQDLSTGQTASGTLATITAQFGSSTQQATESAAQDLATLDNLTTLRSSASGVSSDEELVNMQKAQSAYEAISHVITTAQTMLDALMLIQTT